MRIPRYLFTISELFKLETNTETNNFDSKIIQKLFYRVKRKHNKNHRKKYFSLLPQTCKLAGTVEQTGGYNFLHQGKKEKKIRLAKPGAQLSNTSSVTYFRRLMSRLTLEFALVKVWSTVDRMTSRQSMLLTRSMQSFTLKTETRTGLDRFQNGSTELLHQTKVTEKTSNDYIAGNGRA